MGSIPVIKWWLNIRKYFLVFDTLYRSKVKSPKFEISEIFTNTHLSVTSSSASSIPNGETTGGRNKMRMLTTTVTKEQGARDNTHCNYSKNNIFYSKFKNIKQWRKINIHFRWYNFTIGKKSKVRNKWNKNNCKAWNHKSIKENMNVFL